MTCTARRFTNVLSEVVTVANTHTCGEPALPGGKRIQKMNVTIDTVTTGSQPSTGTEGCLENINGVCLINYGTAAQKRSGPKMAGTQRSMTRSPTSRKRSRLKKPSWESLFPETLDTSDVCRSACGKTIIESLCVVELVRW